jgi:hypothetical protein
LPTPGSLLVRNKDARAFVVSTRALGNGELSWGMQVSDGNQSRDCEPTQRRIGTRIGERGEAAPSDFKRQDKTWSGVTVCCNWLREEALVEPLRQR